MIKKYKKVITSGLFALVCLSFAAAASKSAKIVYPSLEEATSDSSINCIGKLLLLLRTNSFCDFEILIIFFSSISKKIIDI